MPSTALHVAPPLPVCPGCGSQRADADDRCTRCALPLPRGGWITQPPLGDELKGLAGFRLGAPLAPHGPVIRNRVAGPPPRPGGPPLAGISMQVSENALFPVMEARSSVLSGVRHGTIPAVATSGHFRGRPLRIEQHVPGETVRALVWRRGPMDVEEVQSIARELAEGLAALHARGIVHGHLTPDRVLLQAARQEDGHRRPLLVEIPAVPAGPWLEGVAPEVRMGDTPDPGSDLFGLGYLMVAMLNGDDPGTDGRDRRWVHAVAGPVLTVKERPDLPAHLQDLVHQLVDRNQGARPPSARAVIAALGAPQLAPPRPAPIAPSPDESPAKTSRSPLPHWWPVAALILGLLCLFAGAGLLATVTNVAELFRPGSPSLSSAPPVAQPLTVQPSAVAAPMVPVADEAAVADVVDPPAPEAPPADSRPAAPPEPSHAAASPAPSREAPPTSTEPDEDTVAEAIPSEADTEDGEDTEQGSPPIPAPEDTEGTARPEPDPSTANEPVPAAAEAPSPIDLAGRWTGTAMGYPAVLDLQVDSNHSARGTVSLRVASRTVRYSVRGQVEDDGSIELQQSGGGNRATWTGSLQGGGLSGSVSPSTRDNATFRFTR